MPDSAKIQLQGSILSSLAQRNTTPSVQQPSALPNSIVSQNIATNTTDSFDSKKITSALATISNKIEKGFAQTVSVLTNMQIAVTSRLESINRQLQQMNDIMRQLNQTQLQLMKQRTSASTYGLRLAEILNTRLVEGFIRLREQLVQPLSREAINMAFLRVFMDNPDIRKYFGYRVEEYRRRQRSATFTYELYQTVLNIPTFINSAAEQIINQFQISIASVNKTLTATLTDGLLGVLERHHHLEQRHWYRVEDILTESLLCCYESLKPEDQRKTPHGGPNIYAEILAQYGELTRSNIVARRTGRGRTFEEERTTERKERRLIVDNIKNISKQQTEHTEYRIKSINIFDKLLKHTMTMTEAMGTIVSRVILNPQGILFKIIRQILTVSLTAKMIRGILSLLPASAYETAASYLTTGFNFLGGKLFTIFDTILPERFKETFFSATKSIFGFIKNFGTMLFSHDEEKRREARGAFLSQLQSILTNLFVAFIRPLSRAILAYLALRGLVGQWSQYNRDVRERAGDVLPVRGARQRFGGMREGTPLLTRDEAMLAPRRTGEALLRGARRTGSAMYSSLPGQYVRSAGRSTLQYVRGVGQTVAAGTRHAIGQAVSPGALPSLVPTTTGINMGAISSSVGRALLNTPNIMRSVMGTLGNVFLSFGQFAISAMRGLSIASLAYSLINIVVNTFKRSGEETVGNFIDSVFSGLAASAVNVIKIVITKGPRFVWELIKASIKGIGTLITTVGSYILNTAMDVWYSFIERFGFDRSYERALLRAERQRMENAAKDVEDARQRLKEQKQIEEDAQQKVEETQSSIMEIVSKIKNYFTGGDFSNHLAKTSEAIGAGIKTIIETLSDAASAFAEGIKTGGEMLMGGLSKITGGFMYGLYGEDSVGILQRASEIATEYGWHGTASFLRASQNTAEQMIKDAAEIQHQAAVTSKEASELDILTSIRNAETAQNYITTITELQKMVIDLNKAGDTEKAIETAHMNQLAYKHLFSEVSKLSKAERKKFFGDLEDDKTQDISITMYFGENYLRDESLKTEKGFTDYIQKTYNLNTTQYLLDSIRQTPLSTHSGGSGWGGVDTPGSASDITSRVSNIAKATMKHTPVTSNAFFGLPTYARMTSPYNQKRINDKGKTVYHRGVDFGGMKTGTPLIAPVLGKVVEQGRHTGYGNTIVVHYPDYAVYFKYAHLDSTNFSKGQIVKPGDVVARVGSTGGNYRPHLHLEAIPENVPVNQLFVKSRYGQITFNPFDLYESYKAGTLQTVSPTSFLANATKKPTIPASTYRQPKVLTYETNKEALASAVANVGGNYPPIVVNNYDSSNVSNTSNVNTNVDNSSSSGMNDMTYVQMLSLFMQGVGF